jgi:hypothetical protein
MKTLEFNIAEFKEKFGSTIIEELEKRIESAEKNDHGDFKIEVIRESEYFATIVFATRHYAWVYEINLSSKRISQEYITGNLEAVKVSEIMNSLYPTQAE